MFIFLSWCNLDNVGSLWCRWINYGLDFGSIGIVKNLCCERVWTYSWCIWEILLACVNLFHGHVKSFVDMNINKLVGMENFCGYGRIFMGMKFWVCDVGSWKIVWLWFRHVGFFFNYFFLCTCRNFFLDGYFGHVGNFLVMYGYGEKNLVVVYGHVKKNLLW